MLANKQRISFLGFLFFRLLVKPSGCLCLYSNCNATKMILIIMFYIILACKLMEQVKRGQRTEEWWRHRPMDNLSAARSNTCKESLESTFIFLVMLGISDYSELNLWLQPGDGWKANWFLEGSQHLGGVKMVSASGFTGSTAQTRMSFTPFLWYQIFNQTDLKMNNSTSISMISLPLLSEILCL